MPEFKLCSHQEDCPLVMGAVEAKVNLQSQLNVERMEWDAKRALMNKLYSTAVKLRTAQQRYFKTRDQRDLVASRVIEADFDKLLIRIKLQAKGQPVQQPLPI